jgi:hypothetical protein
MFREKDLFKATNMYTMLDKSQHLMANKIFAQSSINQVKLVQDTQKYRQMLYGGDDEGGESGLEEEAAVEVVEMDGAAPSFVGTHNIAPSNYTGGIASGSFVPGATNRTNATIQSALHGGGAPRNNSMATADKKSTQKLRTINKSLAKLDQISQLNWSKKDQNLEAVTINNQVFNRVQTTVDPRVFRDSSAEHSVIESQLSNYASVALAP